MKGKKGVLLINIGTPDRCDWISVFRYLKQFLQDPRVINLSWLIRWLFVHSLILPFRTKKTLQAYRKIWLEAGSPLWVYSLQLQEQLSRTLGEAYQVVIGMRYGNPTIKDAYDKLKTCESLTIVPLFPQYSSAATGSAIEHVLTIISRQWNIPKMSIHRDFYNHPGFISAYAEVIKNYFMPKKPDYLLFSYHGLPERHMVKSGCQSICRTPETCTKIIADNQFCYRAQCFETTHLLAQALDLQENEFGVSFQSRLGKTAWIKPYTDLVLPALIQKGIKKLAIVCPSFVSDCLETLEEVNIRAREQWLALGGHEFICIPCLNVHPLWIQALCHMIWAS